MASVRIPSDPAWPAVFFGGGGFLMVFQDAFAELFRVFAGCTTVFDVLSRVLEMEKATLLGLFFLNGLLAGSTLSLIYGIWKLVRRQFRRRGHAEAARTRRTARR